MFEFLQTAVICLTVLPIAFLITLALPQHSEIRQMCMKICYWGCVLFAVGYFAFPVDLIPDLFFPIGYMDDLIGLGLGVVAARRAMLPIQRPSTN